MNDDTFKTMIALFLQALYKAVETEAFLNICLKNPDRDGIHTKTFPVKDTDQIVNEIILQRQKFHVYFEVCLQAQLPIPGKRGKADGVKVVPGFWVDVDVAGENHKSDKYPKSQDDALKFAGLFEQLLEHFQTSSVEEI
jgi:hypothetical protein